MNVTAGVKTTWEISHVQLLSAVEAFDVIVLWIRACIPVKSHSDELHTVQSAAELHFKPEL